VGICRARTQTPQEIELEVTTGKSNKFTLGYKIDNDFIVKLPVTIESI
jgi:hypothetical protein